MQHTFEEYKRIFDGAIAKYEGQDFFTKLVQEHGRPAFPSAPRNVAIFGIRTAGKETNNRDNEADDIIALVRLDSDGLPQVHEYQGTTEPGLFAKVINPGRRFQVGPRILFLQTGNASRCEPLPCAGLRHPGRAGQEGCRIR